MFDFAVFVFTMADRKVFRFTNELNLTTTVKLIDAFVDKSSTMTDFELTDYYNDHMSEMTQLISATQHVSAAITMFEKIQSNINLTFSNPAVAAGIPDIPVGIAFRSLHICSEHLTLRSKIQIRTR